MSDFRRGSSLMLPESESVMGGEAWTVPFEDRFEKNSKSVFVSGFTGDGSVFCRFRDRVAISRLSPHSIQTTVFIAWHWVWDWIF